ncbi:CLUMA_CG000134, isoform A [Clunio marinus]|uniref:CLUMA_CG000134, isoform A n=1 Tax=Clunio marinus TaxID=568069 RepID=A0A1J1HII2_9DIPT|nr:CLUMA_CG000134, isoform A [Clunio marinus]
MLRGTNKRLFKSSSLRRKQFLWCFIFFLLLIGIVNVSIKYENLKNELHQENVSLELDDGITDEARKYIEELGLINPGENGEAVIIPETASDEIKKLVNESFEANGFTAFISNMVSLNRNIPDFRSDICKNKVYHKNLPKCSIMIPFHNEDWMLLMRTVHSVLLRTPPELYVEILLVDDASDKEWLQKPLEDYVKKIPKMKLIRSHRRLGITNTRNLGAINAIGPILVCLDCHVEVAPGWLEPLLDRFVDNKKLLVGPRLKSINSETMETTFNDNLPYEIGGVQWDLGFSWIPYNKIIGFTSRESFEPMKSAPAMGPTRAVYKDFFLELGMHDPDFGTWGGEDVELSLKVWLCGGRVEIVPCSQTAHMYKAHKYKNASDKTYRWNTNRIAEVLLDHYKRFYYRATKNAPKEFGNVTERIEIKKRNQCKPFKWFLDNVYNIPMPDDIKDP